MKRVVFCFGGQISGRTLIAIKHSKKTQGTVLCVNPN